MPAESKSQRRLMGMAYAYKKGKLNLEDLPSELVAKVKDLSSNMTEKDLKDFAETKEDNLPDKKNENVTGGNVPGMGTVALPEDPGVLTNFSNQKPGSGDIPLGKKCKKKGKRKRKLKFIQDFMNFSKKNINI